MAVITLTHVQAYLGLALATVALLLAFLGGKFWPWQATRDREYDLGYDQGRRDEYDEFYRPTPLEYGPPPVEPTEVYEPGTGPIPQIDIEASWPTLLPDPSPDFPWPPGPAAPPEVPLAGPGLIFDTDAAIEAQNAECVLILAGLATRGWQIRHELGLGVAA